MKETNKHISFPVYYINGVTHKSIYLNASYEDYIK